MKGERESERIRELILPLPKRMCLDVIGWLTNEIDNRSIGRSPRKLNKSNSREIVVFLSFSLVYVL